MISYDPVSETFQIMTPSIREMDLTEQTLEKFWQILEILFGWEHAKGFLFMIKNSAPKSFNYRIQELLKKKFSEIVIFSFMKI